MLSNKQINDTEAAYLIIDSGKINDDLINEIRKLLHNDFLSNIVILAG